MTLRWVDLDFETASGVDLKKVGAWRYSEDPTTEIVCAYFSINGDEPIRWLPGLQWHERTRLWELANDPDVTFIAHNAGFEKAIWRNLMVPVFGFSDIPNSRWHDSMAACAMRSVPQEQRHAALVLGCAHQKDTKGSALTKSLSKPNKKTGKYDRTPETLKKVYDYCRQDILVQNDIHAAIGWLPPGERRVWLLDQRINERGLKLDLDYIRACKRIVDLSSPPLIAECMEITDGIRPTQRDEMIAWIAGEGVAIPNFQKATIAKLLGDEEEEEGSFDEGAYLPELPENIARALRIRQLTASASIKKLDKMLECVGHDGRARGLLQYHGAGPGRWAGRLLQPQNFPRGELKVASADIVPLVLGGDLDTLELLYGHPLEILPSILRFAIVAERDRYFTSGDFAGIEARIVLALSGQHDKAAMMAAGQDVYCDMAASIYKRPITKADMEERQVGKNTVLGCGFQMGAKKFHARYCPHMPLQFAQDVINAYRQEWAPCVPKTWYGLEGAAVQTVHQGDPHEAYGVHYQVEELGSNRWLTALLPSGRKLWYFNPRPTMKSMPWDKTDVRKSWTSEAMKAGRWQTRDMFGGLLTENVVQGLARDLMVEAMFKCEKEALPIVLTVHDEIVAEPERVKADAETRLRQIMEDAPAWCREIGVPVSVETWKGDRYKK